MTHTKTPPQHAPLPADSAGNPLLDFSGLPRFAAFDPSQVGPALDLLIAQAREALDEVTQDKVPLTWEAFVEPLDEATERLGRAWGIVGHLNAVADTPALPPSSVRHRGGAPGRGASGLRWGRARTGHPAVAEMLCIKEKKPIYCPALLPGSAPCPPSSPPTPSARSPTPNTP